MEHVDQLAWSTHPPTRPGVEMGWSDSLNLNDVTTERSESGGLSILQYKTRSKGGKRFKLDLSVDRSRCLLVIRIDANDADMRQAKVWVIDSNEIEHRVVPSG